ncbi:uncharacterized protein LOC143045610 isoform X1 [Mytilus galloprovincialis]|uniref:uncharacterized protein LOC143045610 isoform X1 n=1 Tax=Mytilus galloprovincialis TaxID=29158 RepID=UPI003F7C3297
MEDCPTGLLVDLTNFVDNAPQLFSTSSQEEDKENANPLTDSIEIERSGDTERQLSLTLKNSDDIQNRILRDVTEQSLPNSAKKCASPGLRLIDDETFDFDLAASPAVRPENISHEEEDEVFFGPICFTERLKQTVVQEVEVPPLSPLNASQFALMVKEAKDLAYRIKNSKTSSGSESSPSLSKQSCSSTDGEVSPSIRKHNRSGTFTKCQSPLELLPEEVRKVLPVIDDSCKKLPDSSQYAVNNVKKCTENVDPDVRESRVTDNRNIKINANPTQHKTSGSRLQLPSKLQASKLAKPSLKYGSSCESLDGKENRINGHESDSNCSIASDCSDVSVGKNSQNKCIGKTGIPKTSRLKAPGSRLNGSFNSSMNNSINTSTNISRGIPKTRQLAVPKSASNTASRGVTPKFGAPPKSSSSASVKKVELSKSVDKKQKSDEPPKRNSPRLQAKQGLNDGKQKAGIPSLKGTFAKQSLMNPGELQKRAHKTVTGNGPLKATQPLDIVNKPVESKPDKKATTRMNTSISTPVKQDKCVKPKLLANNFRTPSNSSSTSTPLSNRRRSCLPTPQKSSRGSIGSVPESPLSRRGGSGNSSRLSQLSSYSSITESPVFNNSVSKSTTKKNGGQCSNLVEINDKSPSSMKAKSRVVYTPQLPQKVQSKWSPIRRPRPISKDEEVIKCTKRKL